MLQKHPKFHKFDFKMSKTIKNFKNCTSRCYNFLANASKISKISQIVLQNVQNKQKFHKFAFKML